jgi:ubiquinone/menaquinone biosynthesis C-methylase UbiE
MPAPRDNRIIPFYGGEHPRLFEIERRCMDRDGKVIEYLSQHLPDGLVLDIGAGNGFTAVRLATPTRTIIPLEPDPNMVDRQKPLAWAKGVAQDIPFHDHTFQAAYATWAFFFTNIETIKQGLQEANRVVQPGGPILIVDNAGDDEFCTLSPPNIASNRAWWQARGFQETIIHTAYRFDSLEEARELITFYFGEPAAQRLHQTEIEYKVAVYTTSARPL